LNSKHVLNIMELINYDFYQLWTCNKLFHDAILIIIKEECKKISDKLKKQFSDIFEVVDTKIIINKSDSQSGKQSKVILKLLKISN